jgi:hypothetical protein
MWQRTLGNFSLQMKQLALSGASVGCHVIALHEGHSQRSGGWPYVMPHDRHCGGQKGFKNCASSMAPSGCSS